MLVCDLFLFLFCILFAQFIYFFKKKQCSGLITAKNAVKTFTFICMDNNVSGSPSYFRLYRESFGCFVSLTIPFRSKALSKSDMKTALNFFIQCSSYIFDLTVHCYRCCKCDKHQVAAQFKR